MNKKKILISDFDGNICEVYSKINKENLDLFQSFADMGIVRAIATGRSLFSARKVLDQSFPIDYLIFSSGAGLMDWREQKIIYNNYLEPSDTESIASILLKEKKDFMIHDIIPNNHYFDYFQLTDGNSDFEHRIKIYQQYAKQVKGDYQYKEASQLLAVLPPDTDFFFLEQKLLDTYSVIHATSPLDHQSRWIEIFPKNISKAKTAQYLCELLEIDSQNAMAIGNDFNDLDMLEWAGSAFLVENAHEDIKNKFFNVASCKNNGIIEATKLWLDNYGS
ncbi:MAG: HAD family hydrolase [Candidatus Cloacimonadales bacterium]|jgi:Cof subfamily protein (haloacid dehalogenase superfamily)|nr:HAD family hydrolase [Candidatus Cloacimonadales bacterium]